MADQDKNNSEEAPTKNNLRRDASVSEGVKGTSLGPGIGGSRNIKFSKKNKLAEALDIFLPDKKTHIYLPPTVEEALEWFQPQMGQFT